MEQIPQVQPRYERALGAITEAIENALEHLVIVPREADYGFDPHPYWNETIRRNWAGYPWPTMTDTFTRRMNCLLSWLTVSNLVNDEAVRGRVEECLKNERLLDEAKRFSSRIAERLNSKPLAISTVFRFLKIPRDDFVVVKIDIENDSHEAVPLPLH